MNSVSSPSKITMSVRLLSSYNRLYSHAKGISLLLLFEM